MQVFTNAPTAALHQQRLIEIDSLRGLAAMLVVLYHFTAGYGAVFGWHSSAPIVLFNSGQIGVAIFFVISGFVIAMTLERSETILDFVVSRFARLYPPFWTCALLTTVLILTTGFNPFHLDITSFFVTLTMINGLTDLSFIDPSYWTLTRELLFYLFIATAYFLGGPKRLTAIILAWVLVASAYNVLVADQNIYACRTFASCGAILLNATFAYLFAAGAMLYKIYAGERSPLVVLTLLIAILAGSISFWPIGGFQPMLTGKTVLYVGLVAGAAFGALPIIRNRPMIFLGYISYSLYLLHQVIGSYLIGILLKHGLDSNVAVLSAIFIVILLATAVCFCIERPVRRALIRFYVERRDRSPSNGTDEIERTTIQKINSLTSNCPRDYEIRIQ